MPIMMSSVSGSVQRDALIYTRRNVTGVTVVGVRGHLVAVEAHVGRGLPSLTLTGLPGAGVQDARERVCPAPVRHGGKLSCIRVLVVRELSMAVVGRNDFIKTFKVDFEPWNEDPPEVEIERRS
jgi:hypothetical protein